MASKVSRSVSLDLEMVVAAEAEDGEGNKVMMNKVGTSR